jgi:hypothetical protein
MQVCEKRHELSTVGRLFPSQSSDAVYKVTAYRKNEFPFCSCKSYIFGRSKIAKAEGVHQNTVPGTCKHLEQSLREGCDWIQEKPSDFQYDETCPKCGGPVVDDDVVSVTPEDPESQIDDLRALRAELMGEEPPAPLPKPREFVVVLEARGTWNVHVTALDEDAAMAEAADTFDFKVEPMAVDKTKAIAAAPFEPSEPEKPARAPRKAAASTPTRAGRNVKADAAALLKKAGAR